MRFYELFLSYKYLRGRKSQKFIPFISLTSILGVCIGVATLIIVISVMNGFDDILIQKFIGMDAHLSIEKISDDLQESECDSVLMSLPHVQSWSPQLIGQAMIRSSLNAKGIFVKGVDWQKECQTSFINKNLDFIEKVNLSDGQNEIVLGHSLAKTLGVSIGDKVDIISPVFLTNNKRRNHKKLLIQTFKVSALFKTSLYEFDSASVYIGLPSFRQLFDKKDLDISKINILLDSDVCLQKVQRSLKKSLEKQCVVYSWYERNQNLFSALKLEKNAMFVILLLIIIVSVFNISSALIMIIMEKTKEIGILKALGVHTYSMALIFSLQGVMIGIIGALGGSVLGLGICRILEATDWIHIPSDIYYVNHIPVLVHQREIFLIFVSAIFLSFISTLYPAIFVSRLKTVVALSS